MRDVITEMHDREAGERWIGGTASPDRQDERVVMVQVTSHPGGCPGPGQADFDQPPGHLGNDLNVGGQGRGDLQGDGHAALRPFSLH